MRTLGNGSRVLITGGAGLVGSHLVDACLDTGAEVVVIDNFSTGTRENLRANDRLTVIEHDIATGVPDTAATSDAFDAILHFACPPSPVDFATLPIEILRVDSAGTMHALDRAETDGARFMLASTSEVYGDPHVHPQAEDYWGNVNPIGPRSCYDEAKRFSEAATVAYARTRGVDTSIVRIFNTYGPRMRANDGRVVPTFVNQALAGHALTVHGDGSQTRSMCYIDDLVRGIMLVLENGVAGPVNLGAEYELSMRELAEIIIRLTGSESTLVFTDRPADDPERRRPDLSLARKEVGYEPEVTYEAGLRETINYFIAQHKKLVSP